MSDALPTRPRTPRELAIAQEHMDFERARIVELVRDRANAKAARLNGGEERAAQPACPHNLFGDECAACALLDLVQLLEKLRTIVP